MTGSAKQSRRSGRSVVVFSNLRIVVPRASVNVHVLSRGERCRAAHPGGLSCQIVGSNPSHSQVREAERRNSRARNAAPVGPSYDRTCPSSGRELPVHNADRRAFRRSTAAFSLDLETAFWKRTGAPIRTPLIPRGFPRFHPLHQPVAGRTHVVGPGDVSRGPRRPGWLGRTLRRRIPLRQQAPPVDALC